jgi:hypothetical protein
MISLGCPGKSDDVMGSGDPFAGLNVGAVEDEPVRLPARRRAPRLVSEASIRAAIVQLLNLYGYAIVKHQTAHGQIGTPDVLGCVRGRMVAIEVKRPGRRPTDAQFGAMRRWQAAGALVGWACSVEDARQLLDHVNDRGWRNSWSGPGDGRDASGSP